MIKPNSQTRVKSPIDIEINFTFATSKNKAKAISKPTPDLTSAERRALAIWLDTVLEYHSDEFVRALKSSRKFSVVSLSNYLSKYYQHLKTIVRYYIIASLIDYEVIIAENNEETNEKQCAFINIVIEQLVNRFFRESQWLHKISYLPVYTIFPLFDEYSKGYTTVNELKNTLKRLLSTKIVKKAVILQKQQKVNRTKQKFLNMKLNNNIQGRDVKIYQENIQQLLLRVNLVNFEQKTNVTSKRYETLRHILDQYEQMMTERYEKQCQQKVIEEIKEKEELEIMKQNFQINYRSNMMSKANDLTQNKNQMDKEEIVVYKDKAPESIFSTMPYYSTNLSAPRLENKENMDFTLNNRSEMKNSRLNCQTRLKTQDQVDQLFLLREAEQQMKQNLTLHQNLLHHEFVSKNVKQIQKNKKALQYRKTILQQLQFIREEKKSNHFRLLNYI